MVKRESKNPLSDRSEHGVVGFIVIQGLHGIPYLLYVKRNKDRGNNWRDTSVERLGVYWNNHGARMSRVLFLAKVFPLVGRLYY